MFDAHCHLDFERFDPDREAVVRRAVGAGIEALHVPGVAPDRWARAAALQGEGMVLGHGVGLHPWWLDRHQVDANMLVDAAEETGAEAIGECGLDKPLSKRGGPSLETQAESFRAHVEAARRTGLPLVLHVVGAHGHCLELLEESEPLPRGMVHSFTGPKEIGARYVRLGFCLSFGASFTRSGRAQEAAERAPASSLLVETDAPDQPLSGEDRGEPAHVATILEVLAAHREEDAASLATQTAANARRLFGRDR